MHNVHTPGSPSAVIACLREMVGKGYIKPSNDQALLLEFAEQRDELLAELEAAHTIIRNALTVMTPEQKAMWGRGNESAGVEGEGVTRYHEREAVIAKATGKA